MSEWQPIETAPERTAVLVWDGRDISLAEVVRRIDYTINDRRFDCRAMAAGYIVIEGDDHTIHINATHWMPLPEPPKT